MEQIDLYKFNVFYSDDYCDIIAEDEDHAVEKFTRWYPDTPISSVEFHGQVY